MIAANRYIKPCIGVLKGGGKNLCTNILDRTVLSTQCHEGHLCMDVGCQIKIKVISRMPEEERHRRTYIIAYLQYAIGV